jgi:hypothetical protein
VPSLSNLEKFFFLDSFDPRTRQSSSKSWDRWSTGDP